MARRLDAAVGLLAAIGAGAGLLGGLLVDQHEKSKERAYQQGVQDGQRRGSSQ